MNDQSAIEVSHVCKHFMTGSRVSSFKDSVSYHEHQSREKHEVLKDISFSVGKGEAVAIIGKNGSGKSTILKLLTKILRPNSGTIRTDGRISCLIELGAGFHPDMTGKENVYINASIFGLSYREINEKLDDIIEFSEIEPHINERVRNYSSGMYMRLAFSVAINVDADIMIIDEILAVGDIKFQQKCMDRLLEMKKNGVSIVLVTHSPNQAKQLCDRVIWLDNGVIREDGDPELVCEHYVNEMMG